MHSIICFHSEGCIDLTEDDDVIIEHQFVDLTSPVQENRIPPREMEPVIVRHCPQSIVTGKSEKFKLTAAYLPKIC